MALSTIQIGRIGQAYVKEEATYGTVPSLTAAEAFRHKALTFPGSDVKNKRSIMEKKASPFTMTQQRTDTRTTAGFNLNAILRPSGTINTLAEMSPFLKAAFGSVVNTALSTTVSAGTGLVGGCTLASGTGTAIGLPVLITCPDGKKRVRRLTAANTGTGVVTWAPNLPSGQNPADGAAVKLGTVYKLTSALALSLSIAHYLKNTDASAGLSRVLSGAVVEKFALNFDANDDPTLTISGPGKLLDATNAPSQPGGFTMVGTQPPSGITGEFLFGNTAAKILKLGIDMSTGIKLRSESYGYSSAEEAYRALRAEIGVNLELRTESQTLYDLAVAGTNTGLFLQTGFTEGNIVAVHMPAVELQVPDTDDPDDEVNFPFKGMALESSDAALDALYLMLC
jgi:hypothetical protein